MQVSTVRSRAIATMAFLASIAAQWLQPSPPVIIVGSIVGAFAVFVLFFPNVPVRIWHRLFGEPVPKLEEPQRGRRLRDGQTSEIVRVMSEGLAEQMRRWGSSAPTGRLKIAVISIGEESETIDYRDDFARAFDAAGFEVVASSWPAGLPGREHLRASVTVINPVLPSELFPNDLAPIVLDALHAAGIPLVKTAPFLPPPPLVIWPGIFLGAVAVLFIGQSSALTVSGTERGNENREERQRHREQIAKWRTMVQTTAHATAESDEADEKLLLETHQDFPSLKRYLSPKTRAELQLGRTVLVGSTIGALLQYILDDIDELEKKWGLA